MAMGNVRARALPREEGSGATGAGADAPHRHMAASPARGGMIPTEKPRPRARIAAFFNRSGIPCVHYDRGRLARRLPGFLRGFVQLRAGEYIAGGRERLQKLETA